MRRNIFTALIITACMYFPVVMQAQGPCSAPEFRQFDFWIGEWSVYNLKGQKAGDSRITLILDSCVILEEWTSANKVKSFTYSGKSFNKYNLQTRQWQETWVDNAGGNTEYLEGSYTNGKMVFKTKPFPVSGDTMAIRRLSFYNLGPAKVRQHAEISKDQGNTWVTEYDLEYRRKNNN